MRRLLPNTIFARLFGLVLAALILSQLLTGILFFTFGPRHTQPPPFPDRPPMSGTEFRTEPGTDIAVRPGPRRHFLHFPAGPGFWIGQSMQLLAIAIAAWFGARTIARPIQNLAEAAEQLGDNINSPPMREHGPSEIRSASRVFNRMQQRIRLQLEERGRFLAAVSHDLRTPLTRMRLRVAHISDDIDKEKLNDDIAEMAAMIDATLNYLRGEAHSEDWQLLDIQALVETIAEDTQEAGFEVSVQGSAQPLLAQPLALRRCLNNLVVNAVQYGGGRAELSLRDNGTEVSIEIIDHGPGIPENQMQTVYEPFVRLEPSRNKNTGGVGLGLAIAREGVRRNGGELTLRNAPDGGLVARIALPRRG